MSIPGIRRPSSLPTALPQATTGEAAASTAKVPLHGLQQAGHGELADRPASRAGLPGVAPRQAWVMREPLPGGREPSAVREAARPEAGGKAWAEAAQTIAAQVCREVDGGRVALLVRHPPGHLKAAVGVATSGLLALTKSLQART
jgi:hypothetical protein